MKAKVGISNRHVHLTKETYEYLFNGKAIEKRNDLNQVGEFASTDTVDLEYSGKIITNVRIVGPFREYNQIELLKSDALSLGIEVPIRRSGDLENTPSIKIISGNKKILSDGVIISEKHLHVSTEDSLKYRLFERDRVLVKSKKIDFEANVKVSKNGFFELHINKDEALELELENNTEVEIRKII